MQNETSARRYRLIAKIVKKLVNIGEINDSKQHLYEHIALVPHRIHPYPNALGFYSYL